jgi:hypothetical protein
VDKVKVKLSLCLTKWRLYESGYIDPRVLDLGTGFKPVPLYPVFHLIGSWMGPIADVDDVKK